jgi:hypothetical protein
MNLIKAFSRLLFWFLILPVGLVYRIAGRDRLDKRWRSDVTSYWRDHRRDAPGISDYYKSED